MDSIPNVLNLGLTSNLGACFQGSVLMIATTEHMKISSEEICTIQLNNCNLRYLKVVSRSLFSNQCPGVGVNGNKESCGNLKVNRFTG